MFRSNWTARLEIYLVRIIPKNRRFTNARIDISNAQISFYECAKKRLSNARLNCAEINCFYRYFKVYRLYLAIKTEVMTARFIHSSSVSQR